MRRLGPNADGDVRTEVPALPAPHRLPSTDAKSDYTDSYQNRRLHGRLAFTTAPDQHGRIASEYGRGGVPQVGQKW